MCFIPSTVFTSDLGHPPAVAMFAVNARYKRESYRGSEFAPKVLAEAGLDVVMKVRTSALVVTGGYIADVCMKLSLIIQF
jgi:hypothetical protein